MRGKSSPLAAIPIRIQRADQEEFDDDSEEEEVCEIQTPRDLQITSFSPFRLPDDWVVLEKPRSKVVAGYRHIDKLKLGKIKFGFSVVSIITILLYPYYYEPGTGRKFRSLISVQRHLMEERTDVTGTKRVKSENGNAVSKEASKAETQTPGSTSSFKLPNDWIIEEKPRNYLGMVDRTYIEPETGQRFRSLRAVERHLSGDNAFTDTPKPLLKCDLGKQMTPGENHTAQAVSKRSKVAKEDGITMNSPKLAIESKHSKISGQSKKINSEKSSKASMVDLSSPPAKVNWVLSGTGGVWTPFLDGSKVPESVKLKWSEAFVLYIRDGDANEPRS
ncbi:methyl-CpG-binding domain-containing protein 7-like isoform X1 [Senna tora]|uniref:Methyl-CpG-binding domain-containing protein 7-like isoform X1 n=1 Tax=Senna tora TaxID=362788 RepID=A0A834SJP5_9FABA|nr:methyl-CpG-binding domain-containing protein 7-like isoform X1 [Senna tora]